jgi:hypothetical protein
MRERELGLRVLCVSVAVVAFAILSFSAPVIGVLPYSAPAMLAILIALMLRDFERGAAYSRVLGMSVAAFVILLFTDFKNFPEKALSAFVVSDAHFPESFKATAEQVLKLTSLAFCGIFFFSLLESENSPRFERAEYRKWPHSLRTLWNGNIQFVLLVLEAACVGVAILGYFSDRYFHLTHIERMGASTRMLATYAAVVLPVLVISPLLLLGVRDVFRSLFTAGFGSPKLLQRLPWLARSVPSRPIVAGLSAAVFGLILSLGYYPVLAAQISPKQVFESYKAMSRTGEALGMIGSSSGVARYYAGQGVPTFNSVSAGFEWLVGSKERRWLVIRSADLANTNFMFRARNQPVRNLPVLDARSSEILLVSNQLRANEHNANPLESMVLAEPPRPQRLLDVNLGDKLDVLGWDVRTPQGAAVQAVEPGKDYVFNIYFKVVAPLSGSWETFIHIDGFQRRFNGDHATLGGKYPFNLWRTGDYIVDSHPINLEPNFTPGSYKVYFGLFSGARRLEVRRGRHDDNRVDGGSLVVR